MKRTYHDIKIYFRPFGRPDRIAGAVAGIADCGGAGEGEDAGKPWFFVQKRVEKDGKLFDCHKFRTMRVNNNVDGSRIKVDSGGN